MDAVKKTSSLRWIVLISVLLNIAVNVLSNYFLINGKTIEEITRHYDNMFTPAGFTFSIWGIIYLSYLAYAFYQLLPSQRANPIYDRLAPGFIMANILGSVWLIVFSYELISLSLLVIITLLITAIILFRKVNEAASPKKCRKSIIIPFSLLFGCISVATLANFSAWLVYMGWAGGEQEQRTWTVMLILIAIAAGVYVSLKYKDWLYPLVVVWACLGIWSVNREFNDSVSKAAIITGGILLVWQILYFIITTYRENRNLI